MPPVQYNFCQLLWPRGLLLYWHLADFMFALNEGCVHQSLAFGGMREWENIRIAQIAAPSKKKNLRERAAALVWAKRTTVVTTSKLNHESEW